ncbi:Laminin subunit alpha-5 [Takifugu flavidus]|uniref:Laminin subunit alpha-5 n=1 Tax=Takifugu flavidus TaxID=433684 RepID=A0A5C6MPS5_9TELE|nr:Laminin subunit alpha-5 [Takifugu flavidus]
MVSVGGGGGGGGRGGGGQQQHEDKGMKRKQQEVRKSKLVSMETSQRRKHLCRLEEKDSGLLAAAAVITQTPDCWWVRVHQTVGVSTRPLGGPGPQTVGGSTRPLLQVLVLMDLVVLMDLMVLKLLVVLMDLMVLKLLVVLKDLLYHVSPLLPQLFHVAYVLVKFANSPRPDLWVLERSVDFGQTYRPWQFFA